ncbi:MAG: hypothetical protein F6J89_02025 [Symploca sp. SIO1C4]|uniref:Phospholipase/carboxylesterase/thioesterase domain-containing protein n=1 Tax=Symploca sp. SIO1C4 TaxID=2607765 RepID=A0A6B3NB76_9CYAN|nr:hypothetical protein [Symploca sp. SIO1C4]
MLNKLAKRLLQMSVVVLVTSLTLTTIVMKPVNAQLETQDSVSTPSTSTSNELTRIQESSGIEVILPASYSNKNTYPALIILPYTGGTPADTFDREFAEQYAAHTENPFIILLPAVRGSEDDYALPGAFTATIERYENLIKNNLEVLMPKYNIDPSGVVLGGYSLGGDLSWALNVRNPSRFRGAIVIGSKSTYPGASNMSQLAANGSRFFMIMGEQDENLRAMRLAIEELAKYDVNHRFEIIPSADHYDIFQQYTPRKMLTQSIDYVLFKKD